MESVSIDTHRVVYRGQVAYCNPENYDAVLQGLIDTYGAGDIPAVIPLAKAEITVAPEATTPKVPDTSDNLSGNRSLTGKLRSESDQIAALEAGFAPAPPVYAIGTRVNATGVENAARSQVEHNAKPFARDAARQLIAQVRAEGRVDLPAVSTGSLRMDKDGLLVLPEGNEPGKGKRYPLTPRAFAAVFGRFPCASGNSYLQSCPQRLRSINFNHWATHTAETKENSETVLRTREGAAGPEVFASVSPNYTAFDADKIAEALELAFPADARAVVDYNGERLRFEGLWHTDVKPNEFVAGEFFKAGVIVRAEDTGSGSIRVQSVLWRNLCLNLIILDRAIGVDIRIKHTGSVNELAKRFRLAFGKALGSVEPFRKAWGYAVQERDRVLVERVQGTTSEDLKSLPASAVLTGIFNGILERDLIPIKGRRKDVVPQLLQMHSQDEAASAYGVSRASIVNAFTRYAHVIEDDPFAADEIRNGAGKLLSASAGRAPAPLPYVSLSI